MLLPSVREMFFFDKKKRRKKKRESTRDAKFLTWAIAHAEVIRYGLVLTLQAYKGRRQL